ncbi:tyrosine-type recombinase/integrase [Defluviitalea phaphyphila]|uniref:tyrosine-type recombinase/integrase n=1 Tax=Defluviitalea phaphyphila TaxID=1473580 RepID=UPI00073095FD|nr:tyrosine-type recombinase/integrase [Defluviitalea phaphyphila]
MKSDLEIKLKKNIRAKLKTFPNFVGEFIDSIELEKSLQTINAYLLDLTIFFRFLKELPEFKNIEIKNISPKDLKNITEKEIRDYLKYLDYYTVQVISKKGKIINKTVSNTRISKNRKLASLRTFYKYLSKEYPYIKDVAANVNLKVNKKKEIKNKLTGEEIQKFLDTIRKDIGIENQRSMKFHERVKFRDYIIVLILGFTGIRISELVQLDIEDVSMEEQKIKVIRKGGDEHLVDLPDLVCKDIKNYIEYRKAMADVKERALFISLHKKRISPRTVQIMLKKYQYRSNLNINISPHTFRRSFGMAFYNSTGDIEMTREALGHASVETTRKFYAEPAEERLSKARRGFTYNYTK